MARLKQYTENPDAPSQTLVDHSIETALIKLDETAAMYAHHRFTDGTALAFLRAVQTFPPHTTVDQIQQALVRRAQHIRMPEPIAGRVS